LKSLVHSKHVANLSTANTDIAGGNVAIMADVSPQFHHEGLTKTHDFGIGLALWVKVSTTLATAHWQTGE